MAVAQEKCWNAQKKVIQKDEEIIELKNKIGQLKKNNKKAIHGAKYFENRYYQALGVIHKHGLTLTDESIFAVALDTSGLIFINCT
jgi:hypothetical protein